MEPHRASLAVGVISASLISARCFVWHDFRRCVPLAVLSSQTVHLRARSQVGVWCSPATLLLLSRNLTTPLRACIFAFAYFFSSPSCLLPWACGRPSVWEVPFLSPSTLGGSFVALSRAACVCASSLFRSFRLPDSSLSRSHAVSSSFSVSLALSPSHQICQNFSWASFRPI